MVLSFLTMPGLNQSTSLLKSLGQNMTQVLKPMGIGEDNWPASIGLVSGILAKEVACDWNPQYALCAPRELGTGASQAMMEEKKHKVMAAFYLDGQASSLVEDSDSALGHLSHDFHSQASVLSLFDFILLYFPCISTFAVLVREVSKTWAIISVSWATFLAYIVAVLVFGDDVGATPRVHCAMLCCGIML